jgi:rhamnogalacturonyl hydrolase YesR
VKQIPGLVALWDFVHRRDSWQTDNPFISIPGEFGGQIYELEPRNISLDYWHEGPEATLADFELLGRGPFGQAVRFSNPRSDEDLPVLAVPRKDLHDSPLDIKGKGKSVTLVVWLLYERGNHAIAGMWHEGTVTPRGEPPVIQVSGKRQYGLFAGLQANKGGLGAHISENGGASFGDIYARHLASAPTKMKQIKPETTPDDSDSYWNAVGMVFHNEENRVTAYVNGLAEEVWVENPKESRFFQHAYRAWQQGELAAIDGIQPGEDVNYPKDQFYNPPEGEPLETEVIEQTADRVVRHETYPFTRIEATYEVQPDGTLGKPIKRELVALKSNPYYFGDDIYAPKSIEEGGPFTIGRVIHSNRHATLSAWIGGVAVFDRALSDDEMKQLATIGNCSDAADKTFPRQELKAEAKRSGGELGVEGGEVKALADRVHAHQRALGSRFKNQHWVRGTYYAGLMAMYESTSDRAYLDDCLAWGQEVSWHVKDKSDGPFDSGAYSLIYSQIWFGCYQAQQDASIIQPTLAFLENPDVTNPLSNPTGWYLENTGHRFVDGLFTGPPALAMLYQMTGDDKYVDWMDDFFWDVHGEIFDEDAGLFYRGPPSISRKTKNGKKVLWSRGNGWAFGGVTRILEHLPKDHASYERYKALYVQMAESLATRQQADGFWRTNLDDPKQFEMRESTGTGFFTYGIAWGINNGILDRERFLPVATKGWAALASVVNEEGLIGWSQPPGGGPGKVEETDTTRYGAGIFLMAASEIIQLESE